MDEAAVDAAIAAAAREAAALRPLWLALAGEAVWGGAASARLGELPRLRKRVYELGERLAALAAPGAWLPRPRARLKTALAALLAAQEALAQCGRMIDGLAPGAARTALAADWSALAARAAPLLERAGTAWAQLLDAPEDSDEDE